MAISIRVTDYTGDLDTLRQIDLIGPYATTAERDAAITRLYALPGVQGSFDFEASQLDPALGADTVATPAAAAAATDWETLAAALVYQPRRH